MEYTKEFIEKIMDKAVADGYSKDGEIRGILESFLPVDLPHCPVCDGIIEIDMNQVDTNEQWYWFCSRKPCDVGSMDVYDTKQEAIDAYLDTPWGKLWKEWHQ